MTTTDKRINLVRIASQEMFTAYQGGDRHQQCITLARQRAADAADEVADAARFQIGKLTEAIQRLEAATTTKEAKLAVAWLRNDAWDRMQRAMTRLEALSELVD